MPSQTLNDLLISLDACKEAREWAATQPDLKTAWAKCKRPDWMLWLAQRRNIAAPVFAAIARDIAIQAIDSAESVLDILADEPALLTAAIFCLHIARECADGREDAATSGAASDAARDAASYAARDAASDAASYAARDAACNIIRKHIPEIA